VIIRDVSPGVHAIVHGYTNCFVIEDDDGITLVDAAYSSTWRQVEECLAKMNRSPADIGGLLLTHGHFDHLGFASLIQRQYTVPVWAHPADSAICKHPYSYQPGRPRLLYPVAYPRSVPILASMVVAGALLVPASYPITRWSMGRCCRCPAIRRSSALPAIPTGPASSGWPTGRR
jgi:glyoxylase-like metal-dependent hydrolase (beta-lactamase superfamily II)